MPRKKLKSLNIVDNPIEGGSSVNPTGRGQIPEVPNPSDSDSNTISASLPQAISDEIDDQHLLILVRAICSASGLSTVDINGQRKTRGRTTLKDLWTLPPEDKILVSQNSEGQPIGKEAQLLSGFLGMVARNGPKCPIHYETWHHVPRKVKRDILNFVETRFSLEIKMESIVLKSLGKKWRDYKHDLKKRYFERSDGVASTLQKIPPGVVKWQYRKLVAFWYSKKGEKKEKMGIACRNQQKYTHTSGSKSFARKHHEMERKKGRKVGRAELYVETHTKKDGSHLNAETQAIVEKVQEKMSQCDTSSSNIREIEDSIFLEVVGKERNGRVRGLGMGPTPTSYFGASQRHTAQSQSTEEVCQLRDGLLSMQERLKQIEKEREEERAQMEAERARMEEERAQMEAARNRMQEQLSQLLGFMKQFPGSNAGGSPSNPQ